VIPQHDKARGFSLAELVIVLAILALGAAVAVPAGLTYIRDFRVGETARSVADNVTTARREAIKANAPQGMILTVEPRQMILTERQRPGVRDHLAPQTPPGGAVGRRFLLPDGYEFIAANGQRAAFVFRSDGTVEGIPLGPAVTNRIEIDGMNFLLKIRHIDSGAVGTVVVGHAGRVLVP
jgi:prepilin-type N-terminal cleavage/methylation domain-containing protein